MRAFTLIELLVVIAVIAVLMGIMLPAIGAARRTARTTICLTRLKQFGLAAAMYSNEERDFNPGFSWKAGNLPSTFSDLATADNDRYSTVHQAIDLMRRRTGVHDIPSETHAWYPHLFYTHLVFLDYLQGNITEPVAVCPEDRIQLDRVATPIEDTPSSSLRTRFASSYETIPASHSADSGPATISQHNEVATTFNRSEIYLMNRRKFEVSFPAAKAHMFETYDRHTQRTTPYYYKPKSNVATLLFDASVAMRLVDDANPGFRPHNPASPEPTLIKETVPGVGVNYYPGAMRWTRGGLKGIDFGGKEISTGQPAN